jgi:hypothetical protein
MYTTAIEILMPEVANTTDTTPSLDERKFQQETAFRESELAIKEREIALRECEIKAKETELDRSRWLNPTVIGLFAASIGLISSVIVARVNNANSQEVERLRSQANLVLEAIKTKEPADACKNLIFLVGVGLLDDSRGTIRSECQSAPKGLPWLPPGNQIPNAGINPGNTTGSDQVMTAVNGIVLDSISRRPIPNAAVSIGEGNTIYTTNDGGFNFGLYRSRGNDGPIPFTVKALGYWPYSGTSLKGTRETILLVPSK